MSDLPWPQDRPGGILRPIHTRDGRRLETRFLRPTDGPLLVDLLAHLSPESRYARFHVPVHDLSSAELDVLLPPYLDVDGVNHVAILAVVQEGQDEVAIGVARFKRPPGEADAEAAVVVRDDWQRLGVGQAILGQLIDIAQRLGIRRLKGYVHPGNRPVMKLLRSLGYRTEHHIEHGEDLLILHLDPAERSSV